MSFELDPRHVVEYFIDPSVIDQVVVLERRPFSTQRYATAVDADGRQEMKR